MQSKPVKSRKPSAETDDSENKHIKILTLRALTIADCITLLTAFAFAASAARVFGVQVALGPELMRYFTIRDYLNLAIPLMVYVFVGAVVASVQWMLVTRGSKPLGASEPKQKTSEGKGKARRSVFWLILNAIGPLLMPTAMGVSYGVKYKDFILGLLWFLAGGAATGWLHLAVWYLRDPNRPRRYTWGNYIFAAVVPSLIVCMSFIGAGEARLARYSQSKAHIVHTVDGDISARYVLPLDRYWIIERTDETVIVIAASEVKALENP